MVYIFLAAIPVLLIISLVFYFLGNMTALNMSVSTSSAAKLSAPLDEDSESLETAAQTKAPVAADIFMDRSKIADCFAKIAVGLRIMPS